MTRMSALTTILRRVVLLARRNLVSKERRKPLLMRFKMAEGSHRQTREGGIGLIEHVMA